MAPRTATSFEPTSSRKEKEKESTAKAAARHAPPVEADSKLVNGRRGSPPLAPVKKDKEKEKEKEDVKEKEKEKDADGKVRVVQSSSVCYRH